MNTTVPKDKILIVEDYFVEANSLRSILENANCDVHLICSSVNQALRILETEPTDFVLLDIHLKGDRTGIDLGHILHSRGIPFIYISANSDQATLEKVKATYPYGFLVKPFKEQDVLVTMQIARYHFENNYQKIAGQKLNAITSPVSFSKVIVGQSKALQEVLHRSSIVACVDTTVLLLGESGTGKEIMAQRIHEQSLRKDQPFIKVNCAALPEQLIESELFGHERGAFTGASDVRKGKFERANKGTLFLDEIGELPYMLQSKLLRVLQEKEFERIGSNTPIPSDVRIIAATNKNLHKEVAEGRFRLDLYYRLNVFPVVLPPLRERKEDIAELANYFAEKYCRKIGRPAIEISKKALHQLIDYHWPGNLRELENYIERAVIMNPNNRVNEFIITDGQQSHLLNNDKVKSMTEVERDHILFALQESQGKVFGPEGAAALLKLKVSTLNHRIKKLGIDKFKWMGS